MLRRVLQILLVVATVVLCYYIIIWVLGLLGIVIPQQILVCILVIMGLIGALAALSGKLDNINWWW
jgi:hypothetical protein